MADASQHLLHIIKVIETKISEQPGKLNNQKQSEIFTKADAKVVFTCLAKQLVEMIQNEQKEKDEVKQKEIDSLKTQVSQLKDKLFHTRLDLEKSQQYNNRDSFKICGIKKPTLERGQHEDTAETVTKFFEKANVPLAKEELSMTHRLPSRESQRSEPLLVKLRSRIVRNNLIRMKKQFRENEILKRDYPDAFIVEHLTPLRSKVAYKLRHDDNIEKCWTVDGRIKVVKKGADPLAKPITIDSLAQLTQLGDGWTKDVIEKLVFEA